MNIPLITIEKLSKVFRVGKREVRVLKDINIKIYPGEFVVVFGPSGSGKTTLLSMIAGLEKPTQGSIVIGAEDINKLNSNDLAIFRRSKVGMVFQQFNLVPMLDAKNNVAMPLLLDGCNGRKARKKAAKILDQLGMMDRAKHRPSQLSGGQQQRVAIARALVNDPVILLADEPTGNLDVPTGVEIVELLKTVNKKLGSTVILVTHNPDFIKYGNRILFMKNGELTDESKGTRKASLEDGEEVAQEIKNKHNGLNLFETLRLSKIHFFSKGLRTFLTTLGVAFGVGSIIALVSFGVGLQKITSNQLASLDMLVSIGVSANKDSINKLDEKTISKIASIKNVKLVSPALSLVSKISYLDSTTQIGLEGIEAKTLDFEGVKVESGEKFTDGQGVVLSKATAKNLDSQNPASLVGKQINLSFVLYPEGDQDLTKARLVNLDETVTGVSNDEQASSAYISLSKLKSLTSAENYSSLKVKTDDRKNVSRVKTDIENLGLATSSVVELIDKVDKVFLIAQIALGIIGSVALMVALIGIVNIMTVALLERTHEVGILKAIGAQDSVIKKIFLYEVIFFGLFGSIAGIALAWGLGALINDALTHVMKASNIPGSIRLFEMPMGFAIVMVVLTVLVSVLGGWYPSRRAARMSPMEALRYE